MPSEGREKLTYRQSGVDIEAGNEVVRRIEKWVRKTHSPQVLPQSHGAFGGFFRLLGKGLFTEELKDPVLVAATDGVGTKLKIAFQAGRLDSVGIDLVAMCVNDLVVGGARPLFFLDYIATGQVLPAQLEEVVRGVAEGCLQAECALLGGETAEMPGFYHEGELDLAGFAVGIVELDRIIDGSRVRPGDHVVGLSASGLHSNGFSLVRRVLLKGKGAEALSRIPAGFDRPLGEELLEPTRIYVKPLISLLARYGAERPIAAMAHITGGGLVENIPRALPAGCGVELDRRSWKVPPIFELIEREGGIGRDEMDRVFNGGLGMVLIVGASHVEAVIEHLQGESVEAAIVGRVVDGEGRVSFRG